MRDAALRPVASSGIANGHIAGVNASVPEHCVIYGEAGAERGEAAISSRALTA